MTAVTQRSAKRRNLGERTRCRRAAWVGSGVVAIAMAACNDIDWNWGGRGKTDAFGHRAGDTEVWTIECNAYEGEGRREFADSMATALKRVREIRPDAVKVVHEDEHSRVYYGSYDLQYVQATKDEPDGSHVKGDIVIEFSPQLKRDLQFIRSLSVDGRFPFFSALPRPKPVEDVGPPEWDLRKAQGAYTLQVGVTYNTPTLHDYKQAAVEWVKDLRQRGFEGYYYHDPDQARSVICVGTFDADAVVEVSPGHTRYSEAVMQLQMQEEFKYNLENGHVIHRVVPSGDGRTERVPNQSFLVRIPKSGGESRP